jgi:hypothetical protein
MSEEGSKPTDCDQPEHRVLTELELLKMLTDPGDIEAARDPRPSDQRDQPYSASDLD